MTRLTNAEMVVKSKEHQMWETRKRTPGLGIGILPANASYLSDCLFYYVRNLTNGTRIFISSVYRKWNFVTRLSNTKMVDKSRNCLATANMKVNLRTCSKINGHNLSCVGRIRVRIKSTLDMNPASQGFKFSTLKYFQTEQHSWEEQSRSRRRSGLLGLIGSRGNNDDLLCTGGGVRSGRVRLGLRNLGW